MILRVRPIPKRFTANILYTQFIRAAFKFGRRVHFALRRKVQNSPIARLPAILLDYINRRTGETDCIYEASEIQRGPN